MRRMNKNEHQQQHHHHHCSDSPPTTPSSSSSSSSLSSPPTPLTPLPISVGPGYKKYCFSSSPSSSPPSSTPLSTHSSVGSLHLFRGNLSDPSLLHLPASAAPFAFSLDYQHPTGRRDTRSSCLKDLLEWLVLKCCRHGSLCL